MPVTTAPSLKPQLRVLYSTVHTRNDRVTVTMKSSINGTIALGLSRMNLSGYVRHVANIYLNAYYFILFSSRFRAGLRLDLVSGWLVAMHTYLYYFPLSLSLSQATNVNHASRSVV